MGFQPVNQGLLAAAVGKKVPVVGRGEDGLAALNKKSSKQPKTILVVEPRGDELEHTRANLAEEGFRVVGVSRFEAAVPLFQVLKPDAVLLGVRAPDFSAVSVARRMRQVSGGTVPLFYLVEPHDLETRHHCLEKGQGVDVILRSSSGAELAVRLLAQLRLKSSLERAALAEDDGSSVKLRDPLTGAYNRTFLLASIDQEARRAERYGGTFSVIAGALGGYGAFKKEFGRGMADRLLVYSAVVLGQTVRESDTVARVGDDQFAVLLPGTPIESFAWVVERVAKRFELARFQVEGRVVRTALPLGGVSFPDTAGAPHQILGAALQQLKRGPGRTRMSSSSRLSLI